MNDLAIPAAPTLDSHTYNLIIHLQAALEGSERDIVSAASRQLCRHLLERYQQPQADRPSERLSLAPWQERKAKEILARSLNSRLFIADVAEQCAMSRSHFSRAFKRATGMSPQEWSLDLRVSRAKELLRDQSMPISVISLECGFADQSHFCRMFGKLVGTTPKRWRQLNAQHALAV
ncbi:AraC family transcriptional regulator [Pseudomonas sp. BLCC-B13]|uniref:helix-turn-helix domain-containing protein n=1 Tax=Pseudomonas sp. BLCC-B13 TaxID=3025314 RepID=UPI00234E9408|nr:helix-turn-helix domain-containing protein [Pseudomonas sp. BLCC-B13]MDC7825346.1 AraC family transcriptional regulator [Pseudomonas sp. BLCC-B13]